jgi:hypothetical protein
LMPAALVAAGALALRRVAPRRPGESRLGAPTSAVSLRTPLRATPRVRRSAARLLRVAEFALTTMVLTCLRSRTTRAPSLTALARSAV